MKIKVSALRSQILKTLKTKYDDDASKRIADIILFGQMSGKTSHGIVRLVSGNSSMMAQNPTKKPQIIKKTKLSVIIDGNKNPAMYVGSLACDQVIKIALKNGMGIVGTHNTFSTSGSLSYYVEKIAQKDLIGIVMARATSDVIPFNAQKQLFGTNPIAFGFPTQKQPLIFDMATSAISFGELLKKVETQTPLPKNVALDQEGNVTTNPSKAMQGGILPFSQSYKASGLAMMIEILAGTLPGAGYMNLKNNAGWGNLLIALSPDLLNTTAAFKKEMTQFVTSLKKAKTRDKKPLRIPGENTIKTRDQTLKKGVVEVDDKLLTLLQNYGKTP